MGKAAVNKQYLASIYIRAQVKDKWDSYSLLELFEMGEGRQVVEWILTRLELIPMEGKPYELEHVQQGIEIMKMLNNPPIAIEGEEK